MDRRNFIKTSICLGAIASAYGCLYGSQKICNTLHPENKYKIKSIDDLPRIVRLEACNICQLNCPACSIRKEEQSIINKGGGFGYLKFQDFKNFVDKYDFIEQIELSNHGEIFLNPELDEIIKYAYKKIIYLTANNGVNLNTVSNETLENLVKYKFRAMTVSIDGATPETYKIYRRGGDFNKVISNIKTINKFKKQYNSEYPRLVWQFILFGHNEHEIDKAKKMAKELNMEIFFKANSVKEYSPLKNIKMVKRKINFEMANVKRENFCYHLEDSPQINFNGDLLGCCRNTDENFQTNVFKEGLLNALNGEKVLKAKHMVSDFSVKPYEDVPCRNCRAYRIRKEINKPANFKIS